MLRSSLTRLPYVWNLDKHQAQANQAISETMANVPAPAPANAPTPAPKEIWITNPFLEDFNTGIKLGNIIFLEKTKGLAAANHLDLTKKYVEQLHKYFCAHDDLMGDCIKNSQVNTMLMVR